MVLGLTGGIASGKSSVARMFAECGAALVSADQLAREIVNPGNPVLAELTKVFGSRILTEQGRLDRDVLGRLVFKDPGARKRLEAITHPAIARLAEDRLAALRHSPCDLIVYEAPLLFEAGAEGRVDQILVLVIDPALQLERLCRRDHLAPEDARRRIDAQWSQSEKVRRADYVLDNSGSPEQTRASIVALYSYLCRHIQGSPARV